MKKVLMVFVCLFFLVGCSDEEKKTSVNYLEAKEKIINENAIMIDVRTEEEYNEKHIDGAVLLSLDEIDKDSIKDIVSNKDDVIILYCKSGNRSSQALEKLTNLGYSEVYDLGAMSNWEE